MGKMVYPGDYIGSSLEFIPGFGLYSRDDDVYSSNIGELIIDNKSHVAKLRVKTRIPRMENAGVIALGLVTDVFESIAFVELLPVKSKSFAFIPPGVPGVLPISNIKNSFVKDLSQEIKAGDLIKTKVLGIKRALATLTIKEKNLGVIKAACSKCRHPMIRIKNKVKCLNCGNVESRKLSIDYGKEW